MSAPAVAASAVASRMSLSVSYSRPPFAVCVLIEPSALSRASAQPWDASHACGFFCSFSNPLVVLGDRVRQRNRDACKDVECALERRRFVLSRRRFVRECACCCGEIEEPGLERFRGSLCLEEFVSQSADLGDSVLTAFTGGEQGIGEFRELGLRTGDLLCQLL
ncbi:hypothetical protein LSF60_05470 [Rhodococcus pyridinivorans]|uniref:hypothetical protein n=1 Tax=Rhodococcus pyridinivorans TaxID=103816 RepID=UPI001E601C83|nr:hypothetical protein [Rhodococcus pyridinivorans]UGQ58962.1 hypothetical protein LSF60_05470 [Rhodococcus pyridinivorans]